LTADYAYANKVLEPTVDDNMGEIVHAIDGGGVAGLRAMGYLTGIKSPTVTQVTKAFRDAYDFVDTHLSEEMKAAIGFNEMMFEHALCKLSRCLNKGWI